MLFVFVENRGLARRDEFLRLLKNYADARGFAVFRSGFARILFSGIGVYQRCGSERLAITHPYQNIYLTYSTIRAN